MGVLSQKKKSLILEFEHKTTFETVVVKCVTDKSEINICKKVAQMRKKLQGSGAANFINLFSYCKITNPFEEYSIETNEKTNEKIKYRAIVMESVPIQFKDPVFKTKDAISLGFELLYTIWIARKEFQFYHGDLHKGNVMFKEAEKERRYKVGGKTFLIDFRYIPVIIDFEKSLFGNDEPQKYERLSDVRRITEIMADAFESKNLEPESFQALFSKVRNDSFKDDRFTPNTIEEILTDPNGVFSSLVEEKDRGVGGDESNLKKLKYCVGCKMAEAILMCNMCGVAVCSKGCWESVDSCLKKHARRHGHSNGSDKN
jgi:hypothetical protein